MLQKLVPYIFQFQCYKAVQLMSITLFSPGRPAEFNRIFGKYCQEEVGKYGLEVPNVDA